MELGLGLQVTLIGMGIVFATLYVLALVIKIPAFLSTKKVSQDHRSLSQPNTEIPGPHLAAIAAAIASFAEPYRIKEIEVLANANWERGRYTEFTSL